MGNPYFFPHSTKGRLKMSDAPMCTWCGSTGHTLVDCPIAPIPDEMCGEGLELVDRFRKMEKGIKDE